MKPTVAYIRRMFNYNPETGWLTRNYDTLKYDIGSYNQKGHAQVGIEYAKYTKSHIIWVYMTGEWPIKQIDHKDRDKSNHKWNNLREATHGQNRANSKSSSSSGFKGVYKNTRGNLWYSVIRVNKKLIRLGSYPTPEDAADAYRNAAEEYHGEFARVRS